MATTTFVPVETYLRMESEPDCEYVDGQIEERPMPECDHSTWQGALSAFFRSHGVEWNVRARPELRNVTNAARQPFSTTTSEMKWP
jgi:Putative restriction endonuclease